MKGLTKIAKFSHFLRHLVNFPQFCTGWPILRKILHVQNRRILASLPLLSGLVLYKFFWAMIVRRFIMDLSFNKFVPG